MSESDTMMQLAEEETNLAGESDSRESADELRARNMAAFEKYQPAVHGLLSRYQPQSKLVYTEDGEPDIEFHGERLYKGKGAFTYAEEQLENFWKNPQRIFLGLLDSRNFDPHANIFATNLMGRANEAGIQFQANVTNNTAFFLTIMGIGLGAHIDALVDEICCNQLVLVEPNPEFLYHSTFFYDWAALLEKFNGDKGVTFVISTRPKELQDAMQALVRGRNPAGLDGAFYYTHYANSGFAKAYQDLCAGGMNTAMMGLGFFEDELHMISQSYENLRSGKRRVLVRREERMDIPVFIVGNGPSLDGLLPMIKENQDKAIIIGCGSALDPLMHAGIVPDFIALLERDDQLLVHYEKSAKEFDMSQICLIGGSNLYPGVADLFGESILFFRPGISPSPLFARNPEQQSVRPDPLVANCALSFAEASNFREFYFFGVDVGAKDPDYHHSKQSWYSTRNMEYEFKFDATAPGNFGGTVVSTTVLLWSKTSLEMLIKASPAGRHYYNCSDGALIEGVIPKHPSTLSFSDVGDKKKIVRDFIENFPVYTEEDLADSWKKADIFNRLEKMRDDLVACMTDNDLTTFVHEAKMMEYLHPGLADDPVAMVYRGSVYFMLMMIHCYITRIESEDDVEKFQEMAREAFAETMDQLRDEATERYRATEEGTIDWTIPEPEPEKKTA